MPKRRWISMLSALWGLAVFSGAVQAQETGPWVVYEGKSGPGAGKHIVLVSGDEEYRSEEALPMLARILAERHGFTCTVLFALDAGTGEINPSDQTNIPGLHLLETADLMVLFTRFRELPDAQMKHIVDFTNSGKPIIGLRTATHPFQYSRDTTNAYAAHDWRAADPEGGYGRLVFGETWVAHHGDHGDESTRGLINGLQADHPVLRGVQDIWGPTDVYTIRALPEGSDVLVYGQVLAGMEPDSPPNYAKSIMPIAWTRYHTGETGKRARVFFTTIGAAVDLESEDLRRLLVNAAYWGLGLENRIPERADVDYVGPYTPTYFGFGKHRPGLKPDDFRMK